VSTREAGGLYVHVPFCRRVCPYCDFAVRTARPEQVERYVHAVVREAALWADWSEPLDTIYIGGGTPSRLAPEQLGRLLAALRASLPVDPEAWITLEANPEDVDREQVAAWRALGVRTLSLGVQSFDEEQLRFLVRLHSPQQARRAVELALEASFDVVSIDLIYGLPGQSDAALSRDLARAVELGPQHLSCYQLTVHEDTTFGRWRATGRLSEAGEDRQADMFLQVHRTLQGAGYPAYEVSNFARAPRFESRHNKKYWAHVPYLGLGPSAHSLRVHERWWNLRDVRAWQARVDAGSRGVDSSERLGAAELALEAVMLGLRTVAGIDLEAFRARHGIDLVSRNARLVARLAEEGRCRLEGGRLRLTQDGLAIADRVAGELELRESGP
jgi:oxygen-independent coproporphyrinogen-3 oxidase